MADDQQLSLGRPETLVKTRLCLIDLQFTIEAKNAGMKSIRRNSALDGKARVVQIDADARKNVLVRLTGTAIGTQFIFKDIDAE